MTPTGIKMAFYAAAVLGGFLLVGDIQRLIFHPTVQHFDLGLRLMSDVLLLYFGGRGLKPKASTSE
jgi:hypothetical protein